jgi:hypothetical protein
MKPPVPSALRLMRGVGDVVRGRVEDVVVVVVDVDVRPGRGGRSADGGMYIGDMMSAEFLDRELRG